MDNKWRLFNPRVGLAWDIQGDGRTSLRASGGIATDLTVTNLFGGGTAAPPWGFDTEVRGASFDDPWRDYPGGSPVPYALGSGVFTPFATLATFGDGMSPPTVQSWTLSLQRQVTPDWIASASYMGSAIIHTWAQRALNRSIYFPGLPSTESARPKAMCSGLLELRAPRPETRTIAGDSTCRIRGKDSTWEF